MKQPSDYGYEKRPGRYYSPFRVYFWLSMTLTLALAALLIYLKLPLYLAYMAGLNIVTFGLYGFDKWRARQAGRRVPELILHYLAVIGGAPGGIAGQWLFHHKIRKPIFHIILWSGLIIHLMFFIYFFQMGIVRFKAV